MQIDRHFGLDWLRVGAFALLIAYHVGMVFVPWDFHIKTLHPIAWLQWPMLALNPWRLVLLFVISGFATRALVSRMAHPSALLRARTARLLVPLLFGMAVVVPPQVWVELRIHGFDRGSYPQFWMADYFRFRMIGGVAMPTYNHLWFVAYLYLYTLAVVALRLGRMQPVFDRRMTGAMLLLGPVIWLLLVRSTLFARFGETHAFWNDWASHAVYLPGFAFGYLAAGDRSFFAKLAKLRSPACLLGLFGGALFLGLEAGFDGAVWGEGLKLAARLARSVFTWGMIVALFALADRYLNHDHRWRSTLTEAVFPCYIIHQTIIVVGEFALRRFELAPGLEFVVLVAATVLGCALFYRVGRRIAPLRPLIGLSLAGLAAPRRTPYIAT